MHVNIKEVSPPFILHSSPQTKTIKHLYGSYHKHSKYQQPSSTEAKLIEQLSEQMHHQALSYIQPLHCLKHTRNSSCSLTIHTVGRHHLKPFNIRNVIREWSNICIILHINGEKGPKNI